MNKISTSYFSPSIHVISNSAVEGGGIFFESYAQVFISPTTNTSLYFEKNIANYGGAIYVSDVTIPGTCAGGYYIHSSAAECFYQLVRNTEAQIDESRVKDVEFMLNHASVSGMNIYGGLLDRCTLRPETYATQYLSYTLTAGYHLQHNVSAITNIDSCLLYTSPSPRDATLSRMPSSA